MEEVTKTRVLVIEDNPPYRRMLKLRLESNGFIPILAKDGLEGLKMARRENPDIIITDIMLPGMDGHKIIRMLKFDKKFENVPVIVLTSRDLDEDEEMAKKCGADAFIVKTTRVEIIIDVLKQLLERAKNRLEKDSNKKEE